MEQGKKKKVTIYLPNIKENPCEELNANEKAIRDILRGTPFEEDTNTIYEHLVKLQGASHLTESNTKARKEQINNDLDVTRTLLALHTIPERIELKCELSGSIGLAANLPQSIVKETTSQIRNAAIAIFNQSPNLFVGKDSDNNPIILSPTNKEHLKAKEKELESQLEELNTTRKSIGKATYTKESPNKITDTFRQTCAIKIFCQSDGFIKWQKKAQRNRIIFECLQVFGYVDNGNYLDANTQRSRVRDAEECDIIFVSPPL